MLRGEPQVLEQQRRTTRYLPNAAARPINASRVGPSCQDTRYVGRSHSTETLTCASSDSTGDHAFAPSARLTRTYPDRNETPLARR